MTDLVVERAAAIVSAWNAEPVLDAWVAIADGRVEAIGRGVAPAANRRLDARGGLVLPGSVAAHHHLFQGSSRGIVVDGDLLEWLAVHYRAWARLSEADVEAAATLSLGLLAFGGATTVAAFEYLHPADADFVAPVVRAAEAVGLRLLYVRGSAPRLEGVLGERLAAEGVDLERLIEPEERALRRTSEAISTAATDRLRWACGPTTPVADDGGAFHRALTELADANGVALHTHFHPIKGSTRPGETAFEFADRLGLVRRGNWLAHGSHLELADVAHFGEAGVGVVHAPSCGVLLGYRVPPLRAWRSVNDAIGISVDGAASNDRGSMLLEGQLAWQLQRTTGGAGAITPRETFELMTVGSARAIGWPGIGRLDPGAPADLAVVDLAAAEYGGSPRGGGDVVARLFRLHAGGRVRHLVVGDRVVVEESRLAAVDVAAIVAAANASSARLFADQAASDY